MPMQTCTGAQMKCSFGMAPSVFNATPKMVMTNYMPAGNIMDHVPVLNIPPFGMCQSPSNPMFIAATAAALGTPTPVPCMPITPAPWVPGVPTVMVANMPALDNTCTLNCIWAGVITFADAGQTNHQIP
jgi:hypothetical protein